jgi:hypothetical protein
LSFVSAWPTNSFFKLQIGDLEIKGYLVKMNGYSTKGGFLYTGVQILNGKNTEKAQYRGFGIGPVALNFKVDGLNRPEAGDDSGNGSNPHRFPF